jgi:hypothetical protein
MADGTLLYIIIYKNGSTTNLVGLYAYTTGIRNGPMIFCDVSVDAVTDYFEVYCYQNTGTDRNIEPNISRSWFMGHMLV